MKTLGDYLATSSSDEEGDTARSSSAQPSVASPVGAGVAPAVSTSPPPETPFTVARTPTTAAPRPNEARQRQDEMRERMARLLGQETVSNIAASVTSGASESAASPVGGPHAIEHDTASVPGSRTVPFPTVAPPPTSRPAALDHTAGPDSPPPQDLYERVQVMVVDRGTQTVSTIGTQTEPMWPSQEMSLPPPSMYMEPVLLPGRGPMRAWVPPIGAAGLGVDGRPYRQLVDDLAVTQARDTTALREQLDVIQNSIDMLIARYNLPPPPSPSRP